MTTRRSRNSAANIKNETIKVQGGLITPNSSMSGTMTPKEEDFEVSLSDVSEANFHSFRSHDGLPREALADEGYATQTNREDIREIRSDAPSFGTSRQPSRRRESIPIDLTIMDNQAPGTSLQLVGKKVNLLVKAIDELRKLGLKEIDTELPELVLVGDQSAGKSSLMSAIAEINLPKDQGMCTRCPANIKTSPAEMWSCTVSLHLYYSFDSNERQRKSTKAQPFPSWKEKPTGLEITHFATTGDKAELEHILTWAQIALLNPTQDPRSFVPTTGIVAQKGLVPGQKHEADFSPNLIAIEISGPSLPALSFYDLPGIFVAAASKEEEYLVSVFEKLATKYIMHPNAVVICAMTMANDPGLSRTSAIIRDLKADKRCVGVLTMPDRLQQGSTHSDFDKILRGQAHVLPKGYFVTKQPGPEFRVRPGVDYHAQAREEENVFFDSDLRWTGEWFDFKKRCGTTAIQNYLSQEFANQIARSMPNINAKITAQTEAVDEALRALPALPGHNVQHVVRERLQNFSNGVQKLLEGGSNSYHFLSDWSQLSNEFRDAILAMRPMFVYTDPSDFALPDVIDIEDDSDNDSVTITPSTPHNRKRSADNFATPNGQRQKTSLSQDSRSYSRESSVSRSSQSGAHLPKQEGGSPSSPTLGRRPQFQMRPPPTPRHTQLAHTAFEPFLGIGKHFKTIAEVRNIIAKHTRPGLPDHIDNAAKEDICLSSVNPWNLPLGTLADQTFKKLRRAILSKLHDHECLGNYKQTELFRASERHIIKFLDMHASQQRKNLEAFYKVETYKLFTINNGAFEAYKAEELRILKNARRKRRVHCYVRQQAQMARKNHTEASRVAAEKAVQDEQLGPDPFENEIQLAAYVRGYYKTAGLRFADNLCQDIQGNLFRKIHAEIIGLLEGCLNLNEGDAEATCKALMVEDENEGKLRTELQRKKEKWTAAAESLAELVRKFNIETANDENDDLEGHDSGYDHHMRDSPTPNMQGLVMGRPSPSPSPRF